MKEIFVTNPANDIGVMICVTIISIVTTIGGVGGGGLLIPLYMLIGNFSLEESIPMTIMTILGDTIVRIYFLYDKKHPLEEKRDLIYFPPLVIITLFDANSSFFGVILSNISPKLMTVCCLLFVLSVTFYKSVSKAIITFVQEQKYKENPHNGMQLVVIDGIGEYFELNTLKKEILIGDEIETISFSPHPHDQTIELLVIDGITVHPEELENNTASVVPYAVGDTPRQKYYDTFLMFTNVGVVSIFSFTRQYFQVCNYTYWIHALGQFSITGALGYYSVTYIMKDYQDKRINKYVFIDGDIVWTQEVVMKFIFIGTVTGFVSTYIGIGGGMLTTPIMIQVGMLPEVVVATGSISTLCSCIISCLNYLASGRLPLLYGGSFAICSAIGSIGGIYASNFVLKQYKRQSPIVFTVGLIIFLSIILLTLNAIDSQLIYDTTFKNICND